MVLVTVDVSVDDDSVLPDAHPDEGEYIEKELVPLAKLGETLQGEWPASLLKSSWSPWTAVAARCWRALTNSLREAGLRHRCAR